jgi:hypothetical protein
MEYGPSPVKAVTLFSLGFSYTLLKTNDDSYTKKKQNSHIHKNTALPPTVTLSSSGHAN